MSRAARIGMYVFAGVAIAAAPAAVTLFYFFPQQAPYVSRLLEVAMVTTIVSLAAAFLMRKRIK